MSRQERKRLRYVIGYMKTGDRTMAMTASSIKDSRTHNSIVAMLEQRGTLAEAAHVREREKFKGDVMVAAKDYLVENQDTPLSTVDVVAYLEGMGYLEPPTNNHNFLGAFTSWVVEQGWSLHINSRQQIFRITEEGAEERLEWVQYYRPQLGQQVQLEDIIIVDETMFEEGPHPKGKLLEAPHQCGHATKVQQG